MPFQNFPYTNFHEANQDWIIKTIKELVESFLELTQNWNEILEKINHWLDDAPEQIRNEVDKILNEWLEDGTIQSMIAEAVAKRTINPTHSLMFVEKCALYGVMRSYFEKAWATINPDVSYVNFNTPLDSNPEIKGLDCSSYTILCLLGVPYERSGLSKTSKAFSNDGVLGFNRYFHKTVNNDTGLMRYAYEIAMWGFENGLMCSMQDMIDNNDYSALQTGDIVFWKWNQEYIDQLQPGDWAYNTFDHVSHVGIIVDSCQKFQQGIGVMECVSTSALMALNEFITKDPGQNQELYPYFIRPKLNIDRFYVSGYWTMRGKHNQENITANHTFVNYTGGLMPMNMYAYNVNKTDGSVSTDNTRWTSFFIPYSPALVIENKSGLGYHACYYDGARKYLSYTDGLIDRTLKNCAMLRLEFYKTEGDMTQQDKNNIANQVTVRYHDETDNPAAYNNELHATFYDRDEHMYCEDATAIESLVLFGA